IRDAFQEVINHEILITGEPQVETYIDYYGNEIGSFMYAQPHSELVIDSKLEVVVKSRPEPSDDTAVKNQWQHLQDIKYEVPFIDFVKQEHFAAIDEVKNIPAIMESASSTPLHAAKELNKYVYETFKYNKGVTDIETTLDEIWKLKAGVCQDFAQ